MKCAAVIFIIINLTCVIKGSYKAHLIYGSYIFILLFNFIAGVASSMQINLPDFVWKNSDLQGQCISNLFYPKIMIISQTNGCNAIIEEQRRLVDQRTNKFYCTDFVVRNVTATCQYRCAISSLKEIKTVVVKGKYVHTYVSIHMCNSNKNYIYFIEARVLPTPLSITTFKDIPVKLRCTVMTKTQLKYYKLIWMKGDAFVSGSGYSFDVESKQVDNDTTIEDNYLTIHKASSGPYTCLLMSTNRDVIDSKTMNVITKSEH